MKVSLVALKSYKESFEIKLEFSHWPKRCRWFQSERAAGSLIGSVENAVES